MPKQNLTPESAPAAVGEMAHLLGARLTAARKRRRLRAEDVAARAGITRETLRRVESGQLGTGVGAYLAVLWALGLEGDVDLVAAPARDHLGRRIADAALATRIRRVELDDDF